MAKAARLASNATLNVMKEYRKKSVVDEDDITGVLKGELGAAFRNKSISGLQWSSTILRHRGGVAAEEKDVGADLLVHVRLVTPQQHYSKGVLIQAKRIEPQASMPKPQHQELIDQCNRMLARTPSSFVFDYTRKEMRVASATRVAGASSRELFTLCDWTAYRFFLELFRCPIGDPRITTSQVRDLPVRHALLLIGKGEFTYDLDEKKGLDV